MVKNKNKNNICINPQSMEDMIWMSYRYCIGRHTIAAASHAESIRSFFNSNPNIISEERKSFMAKDIRNEINNVISYKENVHIDGRNDIDTFSTLLYNLNNEKDSHKYRYTIKTHNLEVTKEEMDKEIYPWQSFENEYIDLIPWIRLANYLDKTKHKKVIVKYNDDITEYTCYSYPIKIDKKYKEVFCDLNSNVSISKWIDPQYIIDVKEIKY